MKYYKVLRKYDNVEQLKKVNGKIKYNGTILVGDELYTEKEFEKLANPRKMFEIVEISKFKTYFFFGARFAESHLDEVNN